MSSNGISLSISMNILSTVGVVLSNKYLYSIDKFVFMGTITLSHFFCSVLWTRIASWEEKKSFVKLEYKDIFPLALASLGSVVFMNMNLAYNSVGFYQLSKIMCIPTTLLLQYLFYHIPIPFSSILSFIPLIFGSILATVNDVEMNWIGSFFALLAIFSTSLGQILTSIQMKRLKTTSTHLLYHTAPLMTCGLALSLPYLDDLKLLQIYIQSQLNIGILFRIFFSCLCAIGVNLSNYLVLGLTCPLTYQTLGHFKAVLLLLLSFFIFDYPLIFLNLIGIIIALLGVILYTMTKYKE